MNKTQQLRALIIATSAYYGHRLDDHIVNMYADDLADLSIEQVQSALQEIRRDPRINRFPLPAVIRNKVSPGLLEDDIATEAAARIVEALGRYGSSNLESAKKFIGELGWAVVNRQASVVRAGVAQRPLADDRQPPTPGRPVRISGSNTGHSAPLFPLVTAAQPLGPVARPICSHCTGRTLRSPLVRFTGGWDHLCQTVTNAQVPIYQAQWRELAKSLRRRAKQGLLDIAPTLLDPPKKSQELSGMSQIIPKLLTNQNKGDQTK